MKQPRNPSAGIARLSLPLLQRRTHGDMRKMLALDFRASHGYRHCRNRFRAVEPVLPKLQRLHHGDFLPFLRLCPQQKTPVGCPPGLLGFRKATLAPPS